MKSALWIIVALIVIGGGIWWYESSRNGASMTTEQTSTTTVDNGAASPAPIGTSTTPTPTATAQTVTVAYDGKTFSPSTVAVHVGDTVTFKDGANKSMWVASDEHPTHTEFDGTSRTTHCAAGYTGAAPFDQCKPENADYSFTFTKAGSFEYHDHLNPSAHGMVTVQ